MITEQRVNKELGECKYILLDKASLLRLWERVCGDNNIDYVVGYRWRMKVDPTWENFDSQKTINIALRFDNKSDAEVFYNLKKQ